MVEEGAREWVNERRGREERVSLSGGVGKSLGLVGGKREEMGVSRESLELELSMVTATLCSSATGLVLAL